MVQSSNFSFLIKYFDKSESWNFEKKEKSFSFIQQIEKSNHECIRGMRDMFEGGRVSNEYKIENAADFFYLIQFVE